MNSRRANAWSRKKRKNVREVCRAVGDHSDIHAGKFRNLSQFKTVLKEDSEGIIEDYRFREPMRYRQARSYKWRQRDWRINYSTMYAIARSWVGRPYDEFYSYICKQFSSPSRIDKEIIDYFDYLIEKDIVVRDGVLWVKWSHDGWKKLSEDQYTEWYVDPQDGIIKRNPAHRKNLQYRRELAAIGAREKAKTEVWLDNKKTVLRLKDGVWYAYDVLPVPECVDERIEGSDLEFGHYKWVTKCVATGRIMPNGGWFEDEYLGHRVRNEQKAKKDWYRNQSESVQTYHTNKRTACKKLLRRAGIRVRPSHKVEVLHGE